jgi:ribosome-associated protein
VTAVAEGIRVSPEVVIPLAELEFRASRASGPGGQGVNTTDSRVELRFDLAGSPSLPAEAKELALRRLGPRLDSQGVLRVVAQAQRSQLANRRAATERLAELLSAALATPRPRRPPPPPPARVASGSIGISPRARPGFWTARRRPGQSRIARRTSSSR